MFFNPCDQELSDTWHNEIRRMVAWVDRTGKRHASVLVCLIPPDGRSEQQNGVAEEAKVLATSLGVKHFDVRIPSRYTGAQAERNVDECVYAVVRALRASNPHLGSMILHSDKRRKRETATKQKCIVF